MRHRGPTDPTDIQNVAADWVVRCDAGLTAEEEAEFHRWQTADPRHAAAVDRHRQTWRALDGPRRAGRESYLLQELTARAARRRIRWAATAVATILLCGGLAWFAQRSSPSLVQAAPVAGQTAMAPVILPERRVLPDGSVVELNANAEISVKFSAGLRQVRVLRGAAHFQVAENKQRPFVVAAGSIEVRAVGTGFVVELGAREVDVLVTEGRVAVGLTAVAEPGQPGSADSPPVTTVDAGNQVAMQIAPPATAPVLPRAVTAREMEERLAWRAPRLEFSHTPLADALALLNEYSARSRRPQLIIGDPALPSMRVSGVFRADNAETFVRLLEASFGVRAERRGETIILRKLGQP